jgi:hypothetical protein
MKVFAVTILMFLLLLCGAGCEPENTKPSLKTGTISNQLSEYGPVKVDIMPLTEFASSAGSEKPSKIKVYVSLLDAFDSQIKTPAIFRFELYDRVLHSADPKGKRIIIWPDIDLIGAAENNDYWRDFLRAYEFNLPFEPKTGNSYILQVTALCPNGKRLSDDFALK